MSVETKFIKNCVISASCIYFRFMGLRTVNAGTFSRIQRLYCVPTIETFWTEVNSDQLRKLDDKPLVLSGML